MNDLTGHRFGRLLVIERADDYVAPGTGWHYIMWRCKCDCGSVIVSRPDALKSGRTKSCGCFAKENAMKRIVEHNTTHLGYHDRLHRIWATMKARCTNPNVSVYKHYGGRGIKVCSEWAESYAAFRDWALSNGYDPTAAYGDCTIDRIDNDGDYEPSNCRWTTFEQQAKNRRKPSRRKGD